MLLQGSLSIERLCQLVPVSRRSFYRSLKEQQPAEEELEVRSAIQQIALEHRPLRLSTNHRGAAPSRNADQSQACGTDHAGR